MIENFRCLRFSILFVILNIVFSMSNGFEYFKYEKRISSGAGYIEMPNNGYYVYGQQSKDLRKASPGFLIAGVVRNSFDAFSFEELQEFKLATERSIQIQNKIRQKSNDQIKASELRALNWPRVIQLESNLCVPLIDYAKSKDWKSHLICFVNQ